MTSGESSVSVMVNEVSQECLRKWRWGKALNARLKDLAFLPFTGLLGDKAKEPVFTSAST